MEEKTNSFFGRFRLNSAEQRISSITGEVEGDELIERTSKTQKIQFSTFSNF